MAGEHLMEPADAIDSFWQSATRQPSAGVIFDEHVVMILGPIMTNEHLSHLHLPVVVSSCRARGDQQLPNGSVLEARHPTSHPRPNLTDRTAHDLDLELEVLARQVLTVRWLRTMLAHHHEPSMIKPH
jgi:hypothetical protein